MKKIIPFLLMAVVVVFTQCKKDSGTDDTGSGGTDNKDYAPVTTGSTFDYHDSSVVNTTTRVSDYRLTVTGADTTVNSKKYYVFASSDTAVSSKYKAKVSANYYQLTSLSLTTGAPIVFEDNYLNDSLAVNSTWVQTTPSFNIPAGTTTISGTATLTYKIAGKGGTMTINGKNYTDVINVQLVSLSATAMGIPISITATGSYYYAKGYGMIQGTIDIPAQTKTVLITSVNIPHYYLNQMLTGSVVK